MFNGKYRSISTIIENILRDTDYYNEVDQNDITEWAVRAMELIGAPLVYNENIDTIVVENYRAILPDGIREITGVRDHESRKQLVVATDEWLMSRNLSTQGIDTGTCDPPPPYLNENTKFQDLTLFSYKVTNGYLFFNGKEGCVDVKYTSFPLDINGCLMIPDVDRYMLAIESYVTYKIDNKLYRRGVIAKKIRDSSEQDWLWYVNSAHSKLVTPGYDEAESLKNQIKKIRTDGNAHDYGFEYMNLPTERKVHIRRY